MNAAGGNATHLNAQEIADLRLAGLPTTKTGVRVRATGEGWPFETRKVRGGEASFYAVAGLPDAARADLMGRRADIILSAMRPVGRPKGDWFDRHPDVADAVLVILARHKHASTRVMELLKADFSNLPSLRSLKRYMQRIEKDQKVLLAAERDPDKFKSMYRPALGRMDATVSYAHEMWEIDTTKADIMCTDGRKNILGIIDRWSRRTRFLVVESESAQSVRGMLVSTMLAWGVMPAILKVDNGSGFINGSVIASLDAVGIKLDACLPGHPEDKPHVERVFGTFNRERASMLKGFLGHNVAQAQQLRARAKKQTGRAVIEAGIDSAELQRILDAWVDGTYHQRKHSMIGMPPMEKWQRSPQPARAVPSADVLKIAFSAVIGTGTVTKRGVRWKNGRYWAETLVPLMGKQVRLRWDEGDYGAVYVFDEAGNYVDTALNVQRQGFSQQAVAMAARHEMARYVNDQRADLRRKKTAFNVDKAMDKVLRDEAERADKLIHFPTATTARSTSAMDSITHAPAPAVPNIAQLDEHMAAPRAPKPATRTPAEKMAEADAVIAAAARGEAVDAADLRRAQLYATTAEYRAEKTMFLTFGTPAAPPAERCQGAA
ncbi:Mu transposase C-terminal domain-containing protein [uncultured Sphingobium sp.]|uniref:Mu transposase C-terminal domain-containing protein n=1 Tax=uncultured Sphingobium sp. TaxID=316087 RepID=UPI00259AFD2C|nr:Mu transposase C-terminal domain-containing protein [uncultured Sphingobium sp.]